MHVSQEYGLPHDYLTGVKQTILLLLALSIACAKQGPIDPGNDPVFTIVANDDNTYRGFNRKIVVYGVPVYAVKGVEDVNLLHTAHVLAQYLDNNADSVVDNPLVLEAMINQSAAMVLWTNQFQINGPGAQDLGNNEIHPGFVTGGLQGPFDATLEEVFHLISHAGYAYAYPSAFNENSSELCLAMDVARGGHFTSIPSNYPSDAWYTYDDSSCGYDCMATEYFYWALTSMLGAQANRLNEIDNEWLLNTLAKVQQGDSAVYQLLSNSQYHLPTVLPDGNYQP